jgi:hypothetical protein
MPKGPRGEKRPADVVSAAIMVGRIATGEAQDAVPTPKSAAAEMGSKGGRARAAALSKKKRTDIAKKAAEKRWRPKPSTSK